MHAVHHTRCLPEPPSFSVVPLVLLDVSRVAAWLTTDNLCGARACRWWPVKCPAVFATGRCSVFCMLLEKVVVHYPYVLSERVENAG